MPKSDIFEQLFLCLKNKQQPKFSFVKQNQFSHTRLTRASLFFFLCKISRLALFLSL
jgi:hypothetical protein